MSLPINITASIIISIGTIPNKNTLFKASANPHKNLTPIFGCSVIPKRELAFLYPERNDKTASAIAKTNPDAVYAPIFAAAFAANFDPFFSAYSFNKVSNFFCI